MRKLQALCSPNSICLLIWEPGHGLTGLFFIPEYRRPTKSLAGVSVVALLNIFLGKVLLFALYADVFCPVSFELVGFLFFIFWIHAHETTSLNLRKRLASWQGAA